MILAVSFKNWFLPNPTTVGAPLVGALFPRNVCPTGGSAANRSARDPEMTMGEGSPLERMATTHKGRPYEAVGVDAAVGAG